MVCASGSVTPRGPPTPEEVVAITEAVTARAETRPHVEVAGATFASRLTGAVTRAYQGSVRYFRPPPPPRNYKLAAENVLHATAKGQRYYIREGDEGWSIIDVEDDPYWSGVGR